MRSWSCVLACAAVILAAVPSVANDTWPPAPALEPARSAEDAMVLPPSISAQPLGEEQWRCTFRFEPNREPRSVVLAGSFNGWDRRADALQGPDANGAWSVQVELPTGLHEYKFLVDDEEWIADPLNQDRVPDGFGNHNSFVRLGRLARMRKSEAQLGDGQIETLGLSHRPPTPLYTQPVGPDRVSIRYRTLAHDVQRVWLALRDGTLIEMPVISDGPLFTYREATVEVREGENSRTPKARSLNYTFVLEDGDQRVADPHIYRYSFTESGLIGVPAWAKDAVWYQIMLDRFRNGDPTNDPARVRPWTSEWFTPSPWEGQDGQTFYQYYVFDRYYGGDLAGLEQQLPYLKDLGINALYLNPVFKAPSPHKYDVQNYIHIDDDFGTRGDYDRVAAQENLLDPNTWQFTETDQRFIAFIRQAHALGFKVVLDGVFNHVGVEHPAFKDVVEHRENSRFADWFDVTSWSPFEYKGWADFAHMPVFRKSPRGFASPAVRAHILAVTRRWMDPNGDGDPSDGIDGWRLDVPNDVPRPFWAEWRELVKSINPDAFITGEIWHRADQWLDGEHFDAVMNYEFAKTVVRWIFDRETKISASEAASRLAELRLAYPAESTYVLQSLISSHDTDRLVSMAYNPDREYDRQNRVQDENPEYRNDKPDATAYQRARLAALLQVTYVGAPLIYYGDEVGMWGADDPSNRKPMLWKDLEPYEQPEENHVMDEHLAFYKQVIALRHAHPALRAGDFETLLTDDPADVWAFVRSDANEQIIVVLNASDIQRVVHIPLPAGSPSTWRVLLGECDAVSATGDRMTVPVPGVAGIVLQAPRTP